MIWWAVLYPLVCFFPHWLASENAKIYLTYEALLTTKINSCSKTDNDEAVGCGLNNTMANHAVAQTKYQNTQGEENNKGNSHENAMNLVISGIAASSRSCGAGGRGRGGATRTIR